MNHKTFLLALASVALVCCVRRDIICLENTTGALIPISIRWDKAKMINPAEGATVMLYRQDGTLYRHYDASSVPGTFMLKNISLSADDSTLMGYIRVEPGRYRVVVLNETIRPSDVPGVWTSGTLNDNAEGLRFRGIDRIETFEAFATKYVSKSTGQRLESKAGQPIVNNPGVLASWLSPNLFEVTPEMASAPEDPAQRSEELNRKFNQLTDIHPERRVATIDAALAVMNLDHVHPKSFTNSQIQGVAMGYFLGLDGYSASPATQQFSLRNARYSRIPNVPDTVSAKFNTFGNLGNVPAPVEGHKYYFDTNVLLNDSEQGTPWQYVAQPGDDENVIKGLPCEISGLLKPEFEDFDKPTNYDFYFNLDLDLEIYIRDDFTPVDKTESGFTGQVNDWIDEDVTLRF